MALVICRECGNKVSDRASACPKCGCPISAARRKKKDSRRIIYSVIIPIILLIAILIGVVVYILLFSPEAKLNKAYNEAVNLYNDGMYSEALPCFENLGNYGDSPNLVMWCKYRIAQDLIATNEFEAALSHLSGLNYKDSEALTSYCKYKLGVKAKEVFDWETAAFYFNDLNYENSNSLLTDCEFMMALKESVSRRMELAAKESSDYRSMVSTELAYLAAFENESFADPQIGKQAKKYIRGLNKQLDGLTYKYYYEFQRDWGVGRVYRFEVLDNLYTNYNFMVDNKDFVGDYINQLSYYKKWLQAFHSLQLSGHKSMKGPVGNYSTVEYYYKNNTKYTSSQTFDVVFWGDEAGNTLLGTSSVTIDNIGPYQEYTVRVNVPTAARQGTYWYSCTHYYNEIYIK